MLSRALLAGPLKTRPSPRSGGSPPLEKTSEEVRHASSGVSEAAA